jgi:hypothetical protein
VSLRDDGTPDSLRADVGVRDIDYKAGIRVAGQLVATWLRNNPPTPAKFVIKNSSLPCPSEAISSGKSCKGKVGGELTIWGKAYTIDVPVEVTKHDKGLFLVGEKEIKFGEYGFGDPTSTIAHLNPSVDLHFSIELPAGNG